MANPNISQLLSTTLQNQSGEVIDNITDTNILFNYLKSNNRLMMQTGGAFFRETLAYADNATVQAQGAYDTLDTTPQDVITSADFDQKLVTGTITMTEVEYKQNKGSAERIVDLLNAKMQVLNISISNKFGDYVYVDGTGSNGDEPGGLPLLVADDPTVGTVAGINRANYSFWRNQVYDFSVESVTASSTTIQTAMNLLYLRCREQQNAMVDLILAGSTYYLYYESSLQANQRFTDSKAAAAGFDTLAYKKAAVYYDPKCDDAKMYFLNTKYLGYKYLGEKTNMKGENGKDLFNIFSVLEPMRPHNQLVTTTPIMALGNFVMNNARTQGVMIA